MSAEPWGGLERAAILLVLARRLTEALNHGTECVVVHLTREELRSGLACLDGELDPTGEVRAAFTRALMCLTADLN
jgi:hypothetical protein